MTGNTSRYSTADKVFAALFLLVVVATMRFVWHDSVAGFEDDTVSYLILAQWMSPFGETPEVVLKAAAFEKYPPLFSMVLALTGAAHNITWAHVLVGMFHLVAALLTYCLGKVMLKDSWAALVAAMLYAVTPSAWLNLLGILSENLYLALSLAFLLVMERVYRADPARGIPHLHWIVVLLTALLLTRSLGIAAIGAYGAWYFFSNRSLSSLFRPACLLPVLVPILAALSWSYLRPTAGEDLYQGDVARSMLELNFLPHLVAIQQYWVKAFVLYWSEATVVQNILALIFGALALFGAGLRIRENRVDGWYVLFYLGILSVWPYPDQFGRFLHGVLPVMILQAIHAMGWLIRSVEEPVRSRIRTGLPLVFLLSLLPSLMFFMGRASFPSPAPGIDYTRVTQFYGIADLGHAQIRALRNEMLRMDFGQLRDTVPAGSVIMFYTPNFIKLYAHRESVRYPDYVDQASFARDVRDSGADYLFLADLNPRATAEASSGLNGLPFVDPLGDRVWARNFPGTDRIASALIEVNQNKIATLISEEASATGE